MPGNSGMAQQPSSSGFSIEDSVYNKNAHVALSINVNHHPSHSNVSYLSCVTVHVSTVSLCKKSVVLLKTLGKGIHNYAL